MDAFPDASSTAYPQEQSTDLATSVASDEHGRATTPAPNPVAADSIDFDTPIAGVGDKAVATAVEVSIESAELTPAFPPPQPILSSDRSSHAPGYTDDGSNIPTPLTVWSGSTGSDKYRSVSVASEPNDLVFPIRSVLSVNPTGRSLVDFEYFPRVTNVASPTSRQLPDTELSASLLSGQREPFADPQPTFSPPSAQVNRASATDRQSLSHGNRQSSPPPSAEIPVRSGASGPPPFHIFADPLPQIPNEPESARFIPPSGALSLWEPKGEPLVTTRFTHILTDEGHAVITGRAGVLEKCEDEPIHTPGAVQGFGMLIALREEAGGHLRARYVSENSERFIGYSPCQIFAMDNFLDILSPGEQANFIDHIDFIRDDGADPVTNGLEVFTVYIRAPDKNTNVKLWCAIHSSQAHTNLIICELELEDDPDYPLYPPADTAASYPADTLKGEPSGQDISDSTASTSRPLRILRGARSRRPDAGALQAFDIMSQIQEQLASAADVETFLKILVGIVKELTGFHRVMIYKFDASFNGIVVTELVDPNWTVDLYKGLHFPASDIPKQARDLYKINKVRLLYDRDLETARLACRSLEDLEVPLDLTHSNLRAMSPIHLKYLANMAVRSSMSISLNAFGELWGLISCHSYGPKGMRVSFPMRKMCRLIGETVSRNIERLSYASRLQARKLIDTSPIDKNPAGYIVASSEDLLRLFDADFGLLSIQGETRILGTIEKSQEALVMLEYLRICKLTAVLASQDISNDFPDLQYNHGFSLIAGMLYVPLSVGGDDFIVFFRKPQVQEVKWAGNPYDKVSKDGTVGHLEPRKSFKVWYETVLTKCREWNEHQVETAAVLCLVYGTPPPSFPLSIPQTCYIYFLLESLPWFLSPC